MTALALSWFEDEDPRSLRRWAIAAAIVFAVHLGAVAAYVYWHRPDEIGDAMSPISFDLAPSDDTVDQPEIAPAPEQPQKEGEQPPPPPEPQQAAIAPAAEPPPQDQQQQRPPAPPLPPRLKGSAPTVEPSCQTALLRHLQPY